MDKVKPLELDFENCRDRVVRLTVNSSNMGDAIIDSKGERRFITRLPLKVATTSGATT